MAQRGYPGIHAGMPTPQCLRSAIVVNGAPKSTTTARRPYSRPDSHGHTPIQLWERACSRRRPASRPISCGRTPIQLWERACSRRRPASRPISCGRTPIQLWERACSRRRPASRPISPGRTQIPIVQGALKIPSKQVGRRPRFLISINCNSIIWPYSPLHIVFLQTKKPICSVWSQNAEHVDLSRV